MQGLFSGATNYSDQSLNDIITDIEYWYQYTQDTKMYLLKQKSELVKSGFWEKVDWDFRRLLESSIISFDTFLYDLNIVMSSIKENQISMREINLLKNIGKNSTEYNINYGRYFKQDSKWHEHSNPDFTAAEEAYKKGRDFFITLMDATNAAPRLKDYITNHTSINQINIGGNVNNSQIQFGNNNSACVTNIKVEFDYQKALQILNEIKANTELNSFREEFKENTDKIIKIIGESIEAVQNKDEPSKIKELLNIIKELAIQAGGNLMASGILQLISQLHI